MINLAGVADCDKNIIEELMKAGITPVRIDKSDHPEVKALYQGDLFGWHFHRNWTYWVASCGKDPYNDGLEMKYASPMHLLIGQEVRLAGHCGCPAPDDGFWMEKYNNDGNKLIAKKEMDECRDNAENSDVYKKILVSIIKEYDEVDDPVSYAKENGRLVATSYHIDTLLGLEMFCNILRKQVQDRAELAKNISDAKSLEKRVNKRIAVLDFFKIKKENPNTIFTCPKDDSHGEMFVKKSIWKEIATDFQLECPDCGAYHWGGGHKIDEVIGIYESR